MYIVSARKYRPLNFESVVGQKVLTQTLQNAIRQSHLAHAYLFCGPRGVGKTTCARIFAKTINCLNPSAEYDACNECESCRAFNEGRSFNIHELDAASNNSVDDIRALIEQVRIPPQIGKYSVYIIDEVHMLSTSAFNALLKTMEEPPEHVIFILATTEVQKVPATILSRCQRYDFTRITAEKIAGRLQYVAGQEQITLTEGAAQLIGRLADGALRDALSILDTCAGVSSEVDEELVRRMAGVTDRAYLFQISDAIAAKDAVAALAEIAALRQKSVDMRRLCMELTGHYRNLMLAALPGGGSLLSGVSPEEEARYAACKTVSQAEAIRAIDTFGEALEKMSRGTDQRIELELAVFSLTRAPQPVAVQAPSRPAVPAAGPAPFAAAPPAAPAPSVLSAQEELPPPLEEPYPEALSAPLPVPPPQREAKPLYEADVPIPKPRTSVAQQPQPFAQWPQVVEALRGRGGMFAAFLNDSRAYYDGKRVLIDCNDAFRDFMRKSKESAKTIKDVIYQVTGVRCGIGPYDSGPKAESPDAVPVEQTLQAMQSLGVDIVIEEK